MISVNANLFRAAAMCVSRDAERSYLAGVLVSKHPAGGVLLVATDGHRIVVVLDRNGRCGKPAVVALDRAALAACAKEPGSSLTVNDLGFPKVGNTQHNAPVIIKEKYPDWRQVVPVQKWQNAPASFNGKYLGTFGKIADILCSNSGSPIRVLTGSDQPSPALILFPTFDDAFGILMPMRADCGSTLPSWMRPVMAPVERAKKRAQAKEAA